MREYIVKYRFTTDGVLFITADSPEKAKEQFFDLSARELSREATAPFEVRITDVQEKTTP